MRRIVWLAALLLLPRVAAAHSLSPGIGDFYAGAYGLMAGPVDVLAWVSLACLAGLHAQRQAGWVAETFAGGLLVGLLLARALPGRAPPELLDAAELGLAGALLTIGRCWPPASLFGFVALIGVVRGWHYGADTLTRPDLPALAGGLVLTGYVLVACSTAAVLWFQSHDDGSARGGWRVLAVRSLGSWISAIAILSGGFALRHV